MWDMNMELTDKQIEVLSEAVKKFGVLFQFDMMDEEATELSLVCKHYKRGRASIGEIIDAVGDMIVMIETFKLIHPCEDEIDKKINQKILRLKKLMKNGDVERRL